MYLEMSIFLDNYKLAIEMVKRAQNGTLIGLFLLIRVKRHNIWKIQFFLEHFTWKQPHCKIRKVWNPLWIDPGLCLSHINWILQLGVEMFSQHSIQPVESHINILFNTGCIAFLQSTFYFSWQSCGNRWRVIIVQS